MRTITAIVGATLVACGGGAADPDAGGPGADGGNPSDDAAVRPDGPPVSDDGLFNDYHATSPHYSHVTPMYTDFYYGWTPSERDWAAAHLDIVMSGTMSEWKSRNPTLRHIPYRLHWTIFQPGFDGTTDYQDFAAWFADPKLNTNHYILEKAFLHYPANAQFRDYAHATSAQLAAYKASSSDVTKLPLVTATGNGSAGERIQTHTWDSWRYVYDPADPGATAYLLSVLAGIVAQGHDGVFYDEYGTGVMAPAYASLEHTTAAYQDAATKQMAAESAAFPGKIVMPNTANYTGAFDLAIMEAAGYAHMEKINNPLNGNVVYSWGAIDTAFAAGVTLEYVAAWTWTDHLPSSHVGGNYAAPMLREKMAELASYYMIRPIDASKMMLDQNNFWDAPPSSHWLRAEEANIGAPTGKRTQIAKGNDPLGQSYAVYTRDYDRALVVMRVVVGYDPPSFGDDSKVTIPLPSTDTWYFLDADGTTKGPITSVDLRAAEAAIVIKKSKVSGL